LIIKLHKTPTECHYNFEQNLERSELQRSKMQFEKLILPFGAKVGFKGGINFLNPTSEIRTKTKELN
jgi:hypothetical protein